MRIERAAVEDLNEIVDLFILVWKGNRDLVYSKTIWAFNNERSVVLIMRNDSNNIIGVRGGFEWPLKLGTSAIKSFQLHGTCVHPDYRRKGIMTMLNLRFIEELKSMNVDLIFNVSVAQSRLGYEKLGWLYQKGFHRLTHFNSRYSGEPNLSIGSRFTREFQETLLKKRNSHFSKLDFHTDYSNSFYDWRVSNEKEGYSLVRINESLLLYKIDKSIPRKTKLIIGDVFLNNYSFSEFKLVIKALMKAVKPVMTFTYISKSHPLFFYYVRLFFIPNPKNYHLNFGVKSLRENTSFNGVPWAVSYIDIDTF